MEHLPCAICKHSKRAFIILLIIVGSTEADDLKFRCGPGINTPGVTIPSGDIIIEHGDPLEIFCVLNPSIVSEGFNSSQLVFYHTSHQVLPEFIKRVNVSTAQLYIERPPPMRDMFYCKLQNGTEESPVCLNTVAVGFKPKDVLNFSCISHNWDNLNCSWVPPVNYVKTKYNLYYYLRGRAGSKLKLPCPHDTDVKGKNYCYWDQSTDTPYRQPYEYYYFVMTGDNKFGNKSQKYTFHHYAYVIPTMPANLTCLERTTNTVLIQWSVVFPMQNFPPGVLQKVEYQSAWDDGDFWQLVNTSSLNIKNATHHLNVTGLKYPNTMYDLRVSMRSPLAKGEHMWSKPASITFRTKPTVPGAAPKTDIGSFEVMTTGLNMRDIYVYWQHIPEYMYNGENFNYVVYVEEDGVPRNLQANETTAAYAMFKGLSLNSYRFRIVSANQEGFSKDHSEVFVPSQANSLAEPLSFTKIAFDHRIYELSWKPNMNPAITSYTIFWCDNKKDRPFQCTGTLNWTRVPRDVTITNITVPEDKIYQFAISANTDMESSGMVWASCTVIHNRILGKMKSVWINRIGSTFIEVGWKLECSDRIGMVTGFLISYCPIDSPPKPKCKVEAKNTTIVGDGMTIRGNVTNLTPYTTYMVMVAVMTKNSIGQWSDRQYNTTLESAPDMPPQNVIVSDLTNTSLVVKWTPPSSMNGVLRYYMVHYNDHDLKVEGTKGNLNTQYQLTKLASYTWYNVSVSACTVACSTRSPPIAVQTDIGVPGKMFKPTVRFVNSSQVEVIWDPPEYQAGNLDKYEVRVEVLDNDYNITELIDTTGTQKQIPIKDCDSGGPHHTYLFAVRAVNFANETIFYGPWSDAGEGNCYTAAAEEHLWIIMWVTIFLFCTALGIVGVFLGKQLWERYKQMRSVEVKLPPGLAPVIEKSIDSDYHSHLNLYGWSPASEKQVITTPDQELLLHKKDVMETGDHSSIGDGDMDAESSGCSSGHESVASSLTAGTHISTDSGTEADALNGQSISLDTVFPPATSLRQRNKASSSSSGSDNNRWDRNEPYVMIGGSTSCLVKSTPNLNEGEGGPAGYSLLGGPTLWRPTAAPTATGYVSLPPTVNASPPYVAHTELWSDKEPMSPTIPNAPNVPSKGYVMAGESAAPYCRLDYLPHRRTDNQH